MSRATAVSVCGPLLAPVVFQANEYGDAPVTSAPRFAPSSLNCTPATATLSLAVAVIVTVPVAVLPAVGAVIATVGGVVSLLTVTVTPALVVVRLEVSRATAVSVWEPLVAPVVFQVSEYGDVPVTSAPRFAPSSLNCTPATATLSAAVAVTVTEPLTVAPAAGAVRLTVGGVVSTTLLTVTGTPALVVVRFAPSRATAVRVCGPFTAPVVFQVTENGDVPVASAPRLTPSSLNCTPATLRLSLAVAVTVTIPLTVAFGAGPVIVTAGGVVSTVTETGALVVVRFTRSRATAVSVCGPFVTPAVFHTNE